MTRTNSIMKKCMAHVLSVLMITSMIGANASLMLPAVYAANRGSEIQAGDILDLKAGSWEEQFIVLDPTRTNTDEEGMLVLRRNMSDDRSDTDYYTEFDYDGYTNRWEGSTAQSWCYNYYRNLPDAVRNRIIGVKTTETESGKDFMGVNNIDGTKSNKDKVFFLSVHEYDTYRESAKIELGRKWWLRSFGMDCASDMEAYAALVEEDGRARDWGISFAFGARPAFNLDLPQDICATSTVDDKGKTVWTVDAEHPEHEVGAVSYNWSKDYKQCTAQAVCSDCGNTIRETVDAAEEITMEPTEEGEGLANYTARFRNAFFETQVKKNALLPKQGQDPAGEDTPQPVETHKVSELKVGDRIYMGKRDAEGYTGLPCWRILDIDDSGNMLFLSEYLWKGDGTHANEYIQFNPGKGQIDWQGSIAQQWCKSFEKDVLSSVDGLTIRETTKTDGAYVSPDDASVAYAKTVNILNRDHVFYLSAEEIIHYLPTPADRAAYLHDGTKQGKCDSYWLRSPRDIWQATCVGRVFGDADKSKTGKVGRNEVDQISAVRPAFWGKLDAGTELVRDADGNWNIHVACVEHSYGKVRYSWSDDHTSCTATAYCRNCGEEVNETVTVTRAVQKEASVDAEGRMIYTANFENPMFGRQTTEMAIAKKPVTNGYRKNINGSTYQVLSTRSKTVACVKAGNVKTVTLPASVKIAGKSYAVSKIGARAFGKKTGTVIIKTKKLTKSGVKNSLKGSKVKTVKVKVGTKSANKKYVKKYKKYFAKTNAGRKVSVK